MATKAIMACMNIARFIMDFIRWRDWGPGKIPVLCTVCLYIGLANHQVSMQFIHDFVLFLVFAMLNSALGYVVNDYGDRELDALHNKPNAFAKLTNIQGILALSALTALALLSGLPFIQRPFMLFVWLGWVFFAFGYSLRPLRLKERGAWGLIVSSLAQWVLPILLAFAALNRFGEWDMTLVALSISISGATLELAHQRWDRVRDASTKTRTLGSRITAAKMDQYYAIALVTDKIAIGVFLVTIILVLPSGTVRTWTLSPGLPLLAIYIVLCCLAIHETIRLSRRGEFLDPYYSTQRSASKLLHETLSNLIMPAYLMILATIQYPVNGFLLMLFLIWRLVLGQADWRWPLRALRTKLLK